MNSEEDYLYEEWDALTFELRSSTNLTDSQRVELIGEIDHVESILTQMQERDLRIAPPAPLTPEEAQAKWDAGNSRKAAILAQRARG